MQSSDKGTDRPPFITIRFCYRHKDANGHQEPFVQIRLGVLLLFNSSERGRVREEAEA